MDDIGKKPGGGNHPQDYLKKGNGPDSGEYVKEGDNKSAQENTNNDCKLIESILTKEELKDVIDYTNFETGTKLNKAIRENNLSEYGLKMKNNIVNAINKVVTIKENITYRGISVTNQEFIKFLNSYFYDTEITGSTICSISRNEYVAISKTMTQKKNMVPIVFECVIPKGYHALYVAAISNNPEEEEFIINAPRYKIKKVESKKVDGYTYQKIYVKLIGDNHEH